MEKFVQIKTNATGDNEAYVRSCIAAFCVSLDPSLEEINDVKTAVSEAVTNVVVHAYRGRTDGELSVTARIDGRVLYIDITDQGCGIADTALARQAFYSSAQGEERSGLGFTIMETFMDDLKVVNNADGGVTISMKKEFSAPDAQYIMRTKGDSFARAQ